MFLLTHKIRLYPTPAQESALEAALEVCRGVYNSFLHWRTFAFETEGPSPTRLKQEKALTAYTSQDCSGCGVGVAKTLSERVHVCPCCGLVLDRDTNAARNILQIAVGLHSVPARQERSHADLAAVE